MADPSRCLKSVVLKADYEGSARSAIEFELPVESTDIRPLHQRTAVRRMETHRMESIRCVPL
jgi:hypothetical protein